MLAAALPHHAARFFLDHGWNGFLVLGSVFLVVTGGEALSLAAVNQYLEIKARGTL